MMQRILFLFALSLFIFVRDVPAQQKGKVIEKNIIQSENLKREVEYSVYLPPDYFISERSYPVLYLLHGYGDNNTAWVQYAEINRQMDEAIEKGIVPPMVIIMPDGKTSFFMNTFDGKENYEDFFIKELVPSVETKFRIRKGSRYHAVAGLSMGGYGALLLSMKHPDLFGGCVAFSAAVRDDESIVEMPQESYDRSLGARIGRGLKGKERLTKHWYDNSPIKLTETLPVESLKKISYWIDCGDDDYLSNGNSLLHMAMKKRDIPHEYRVRDGNHNWTYWRTGFVEAVTFLGKKFRNG